MKPSLAFHMWTEAGRRVTVAVLCSYPPPPLLLLLPLNRGCICRCRRRARGVQAVLVGVSLQKLSKEAQTRVTLAETRAIKELSRKPKVLDLLARSLAPSIYGHDIIKKGEAGAAAAGGGGGGGGRA